MNKKLYLLLASFVYCFGVFAKDVDVNYAKQVAQNFYLQNTQHSGELTLAYACTTKAGVGRSSDGQSVYYVFNVGNNQGFVIVSGDDLVQPILGYSTEGNYTLNNMAPATNKWMNNYEKQIVYVKENETQTTDEIKTLWYDYYNNINPLQYAQRGTQAVNPLCQTKWNQDPYENAMCPYDNGYGQRTVTGCVATAMAQIIKYYNYPDQGTGFHSYNDQNYGTQSANFGSTTYQWTQMPNLLTSNNSAVATLMYHCGVSVDMHYGVGATGGSSAYVVASESPVQACAEYSYKTYFGYDPATLQGVVRQNYSDANWSNLLKTELDNSRPIQYAGFGNGGGHTWVCDGYDANSFFHMNWGWGGNSDGFFSLNNLDPSALGAGGGTGGFNTGQQAVIGIKPLNGGGGGGGGGGGTVNPDGIQLYSATTVSANPFQSGGSFSVYADIANLASTDFTGDFAAALFTDQGVFVDFIQEYTNQTAQAGFHYNVTFTANTLSLIPGTYQIGIFYKSGSNNYSLIDPATFYNPVTITVTGPYSDMQMYDNTTVTPTVIVKNQSFTVDTKIANYAATNFNGYLSADLFDDQGNYVQNIQVLSGVSLQAGYFNSYQFASNGMNVTPGSYYIGYFSSTDGQNWNLIYTQSYPNPVPVTVADQPLSPDIYEANNTANAAYPFQVNFSGNNASITSAGSNNHIGSDYDYYKINLPSGTNYSINARVHDSYSSGNGNNYTNDVQFSYQVNGGTLSDAYDDVMPSPIYVAGGGTVIFFVSDYFTGTVGTYLLDMNITRGQNVGINDVADNKLVVFPNPANNQMFIDAGNLTGEYTLNIFDLRGQLVSSNTGTLSNQLIKTDVSTFAKGMYSVQLKTANGTATSKLIVE